jgi:hypothetical protein
LLAQSIRNGENELWLMLMTDDDDDDNEDDDEEDENLSK